MRSELSLVAAGISDPLILAGAVLLTGFLTTRLVLRSSVIGRFICQLVTFASFTVMLVVANVSPLKPTPAMALTITYGVITFFKIIWWFAASWLLAGLVRTMLVFKRRPVETRFLQDLCAGLIYVGAVIGIIANVFDTAVSGLLAASGVIAIVLGLALQSTLGDVFSGVVLNLAKPFHPGDWVVLDSGLEGRVIETNWRATKMLTGMNDVAVVPNSIIAKTRITNASLPTPAHGLTLTVRIEPIEAPSRVAAMLETALLNCDQILRAPLATVMVRSLDAVALECELTFFVSEIERGPSARTEVFDRVFRHCAAAGLRLAPPAGSAMILTPRGDNADHHRDIPKRLLGHLPIFETLSNEEREALAPMMRPHIFKAGDVLVEQGVVAPAFFILTAGVLAAFQRHGGDEIEVMRLAPGDYFGQASVLTGATTTFKVKALTRVTVYEISRSDFAPILKNRPSIAAELSRIMLKRAADGRARLVGLDIDDGPADNLGGRITDRIKVLFGLS